VSTEGLALQPNLNAAALRMDLVYQDFASGPANISPAEQKWGVRLSTLWGNQPMCCLGSGRDDNLSQRICGTER
jgi:hypothetical protein